MMPPTQSDAFALPDDDLAMHAGEQIFFGVSTATFAAIGAPPSFVKWIKFMVTGHRRVIRTAYSMGDPASEFTHESGTPQGGVPFPPYCGPRWLTLRFATPKPRAPRGSR